MDPKRDSWYDVDARHWQMSVDILSFHIVNTVRSSKIIGFHLMLFRVAWNSTYIVSPNGHGLSGSYWKWSEVRSTEALNQPPQSDQRNPCYTPAKCGTPNGFTLSRICI